MSLNISKLSFAYDSENSFQFEGFNIPSSEHALILGASGMGKTTLLHLIAGLLKPSGGKVELQGVNLSSLNDEQMDRFRGKEIGIIFQTPHFIRSLNVYENIAIAQRIIGSPVDQEKIRHYLDELNILEKAKSRINSLSVGEKQRVSIIRSIINEPSIILADEPTSALDDKNCNAVIRLLKESAESVKASLLVVTHDNRLKSDFPNQINLNE